MRSWNRTWPILRFCPTLNSTARSPRPRADVEPVVLAFREYRDLQKQLEENKELLSDEDHEIREMAQEEIHRIEKELPEREHKLRLMLLPPDPLDEKNTVLEVRAGTGGEEAALFAADLFHMYCRYAELQHWKVEIISEMPTDSGGYKEVIALVSGKRVYSRLRYESGTHRVQRVPATESQGRIHTSAATVAVMPEAEESGRESAPRRSAHRRVPRIRRGRPARQQDGIGCAHHAHSHGHRGHVAKTNVPSTRTRPAP